MITTFLNLPPFDKGLVFFGSIFVFIFCIRQIKGYLSKIDESYLTQLSEFANHNRVEAAKAGHVALHELSFSSHGWGGLKWGWRPSLYNGRVQFVCRNRVLKTPGACDMYAKSTLADYERLFSPTELLYQNKSERDVSFRKGNAGSTPARDKKQAKLGMLASWKRQGKCQKTRANMHTNANPNPNAPKKREGNCQLEWMLRLPIIQFLLRVPTSPTI